MKVRKRKVFCKIKTNLWFFRKLIEILRIVNIDEHDLMMNCASVWIELVIYFFFKNKFSAGLLKNLESKLDASESQTDCWLSTELLNSLEMIFASAVEQ